MTTTKATRIREAPFNLDMLAHVVEQECDKATAPRKRKASARQLAAAGHSSDDNYFDESLVDGYNRDELDTLACLQHMAEFVEAEEDERRRRLKRSSVSDADVEAEHRHGANSRARAAACRRAARAHEVPSHLTETTLFSLSKQQMTPDSDRAESLAGYSHRPAAARPRRSKGLATAGAADSDPRHSNPSISTKSLRHDNGGSGEVTSDISAKSAPHSHSNSAEAVAAAAAAAMQANQAAAVPMVAAGVPLQPGGSGAAADAAATGLPAAMPFPYSMPGSAQPLASSLPPFMPPFMPFPSMMPMMMGAMYNPFMAAMTAAAPGAGSSGSGPPPVQGIPAASQPVPGLPPTPEPAAPPSAAASADGASQQPAANPMTMFAQQHMKAMMASFAQAMARPPFMPGMATPQQQQQPTSQPQQAQPAAPAAPSPFSFPYYPFYQPVQQHQEKPPAVPMEAYLTPDNIARVLPALDVARIKPWVQHNFCDEAFLLLMDVWRSDSPKVKEAVWAHYNHIERPDAPDYRAFMVSVFGLDKLVQITQASRVSAAARASQQQQAALAAHQQQQKAAAAAAARQRQQQHVVLVTQQAMAAAVQHAQQQQQQHAAIQAVRSVHIQQRQQHQQAVPVPLMRRSSSPTAVPAGVPPGVTAA